MLLTLHPQWPRITEAILPIAYIRLNNYLGFTQIISSYDQSQVGREGNIEDHATYVMDLAEANKKPNETPVWRYLYSAKEAYQVKRAPGQSTFDCFSTSLRAWNLAPGQTLSSSSKPIPPSLSDSISSTIGLNSDDLWYIVIARLTALLINQN